MSLIQTLPNGALDIIGDVHGQYEALQNLLHYLGYQADGNHPKGRKLVFVGDLIDRGPDSPAVLAWFEQAYYAGHALMVLGNHEINLLAQEAKDGSGWFFGNREQQDAHNYAPWQCLPQSQHSHLLTFLQQQPLVLQRQDLRIVHAAWLSDSIAQIQNQNHVNLCDLIQDWDDEINFCIKQMPWYEQYKIEQRQYAHELENINYPLPMLRATAQHDVYRSINHPIRALTCGVEKVVTMPFFAGGRWRFSIRNHWWEDYQDVPYVVIGHYWRTWYEDSVCAKHSKGMFNVPPNHWHGARNNVFCIDFSVGARWRDRKKGIIPMHSKFRLAALRFPEKTLMFDNGEFVDTKSYC